MTLLLTDELAQALLGGLLAVCRADGDATTEEMRALRRVGDELTGGVRVDNEWLLFFSSVTPHSLAEAVRQAAAAPFRHRAVSGANLIAHQFVRAAAQVGRADGQLNEAEARLIRAFAESLGLSAQEATAIDHTLGDAWLEANFA
jgi:uncharacterized tellurite resistance protein B-like protein